MGRTVLNQAGTAYETVSGVVIIDPATGAATGQGLTDAQLRAAAVPVSGPITDTQLRATPIPVAPNVSRGAGAVDANTQRVTLAGDGPGVAALTSLDNKTPALVGGAQPVVAQGRICLGTVRLSVTTSAQTLAALSGTIPAGAVVCELQADGTTVRVSRFDSMVPTSTTGFRLDDGAVLNIDSTLAHVRLIAASATFCNATFFDRV